MYRLALGFLAVIALSGCSVSRPIETATMSLDQRAQGTMDRFRNSNASKPEIQAFASLPSEAGRVKNIRQKHLVDGVRQEIVYDQPVSGLNDNGIDLRMRTSDAVSLDESLALAKPTEAGIRAELAAMFPRMLMQVVEQPRSNAYGPYGLAIGRWVNGVRCIYAWQWIDDVKTELPGQTAHAASVRVRLCRAGTSLDQMAAYVDRLQIEPVRQQQLDVQELPKIVSALPQRPVRRVAHRAPQAKPQMDARSQAPQRREIDRAEMRPAVVAAIPQSVSLRQDAPLDPSLPAAAYRGPIAVTPSGK